MDLRGAVLVHRQHRDAGLGMNLRWLSRVIASTLVRRLTLVLLAIVLAYFGVGKAHAGCTQTSDPATMSCVTKGEATMACNAEKPSGGVCKDLSWAIVCSRNGGWSCDHPGGGPDPSRHSYWRYGSSEMCPGGRVWDGEQCTLMCPGGYIEDASNPGTCMDFDKCTQLNQSAGYAFEGNVTKGSKEYCPQGCQYKAVGPSVCIGGGGLMPELVCSGHYETTGAACSKNPQPTNNEKNSSEKKAAADRKDGDCKPMGTLTMCMKANGQHCVTASTGWQQCWNPGETGEKANGPNLQKKEASANSSEAPSTPPPADNTWRKTGTASTNESVNGGAPTPVTFTNYTTSAGGDTGQRQGEESGKKDTGNESGGGATCVDPPISTGDPILAQIATQTWKTRCAIEGRKVEGGECLNGAPVAFNCSGDQIACKQALLQMQAKCRDEKNDANGDGINDGLQIEADSLDANEGEGADEGDVFKDEGDGDDGGGFDLSGFGYGSACPEPPEFYGVPLDWAAMCNIFQLVGGMVVAMGMWHGFQIVSGV